MTAILFVGCFGRGLQHHALSAICLPTVSSDVLQQTRAFSNFFRGSKSVLSATCCVSGFEMSATSERSQQFCTRSFSNSLCEQFCVMSPTFSYECGFSAILLFSVFADVCSNTHVQQFVSRAVFINVLQQKHPLSSLFRGMYAAKP